jgi:hypothetical protein
VAIQKVVLPSEFLPLPKKDGKIYFRYRIKSADNVATSSWSDIKSLQGNVAADFSYYSGTARATAAVSIDSLSINLEWDALGGDILKNSKFDIFAKWSYPDSTLDDANYFYVATVFATSYFLTIPYEGGVGEKATAGNFLIQIATQEKEENSSMEVARIENVSTTYSAPPIDGGEIV